MADHEIHNPKDYSETLRKLLTTDPAHADTFNPLFERLINNDAYLKAFIEGILAASTGHKHSGTDGDGPKIPLANIDVPTSKGSIVTADQLTAHINERNPHGTRASDVGAVSEQEFATHLADTVKHITSAERTAWNSAEANAKAYTDTAPEAMQRNLGIFNVYKSGKDSNGIFTIVEYKRADGTLYARSVLSGGTSPQYTTRTITYYTSNGITVLRTDTYALTYDTDGDLINEVKQ